MGGGGGGRQAGGLVKLELYSRLRSINPIVPGGEGKE